MEREEYRIRNTRQGQNAQLRRLRVRFAAARNGSAQPFARGRIPSGKCGHAARSQGVFDDGYLETFNAYDLISMRGSVVDSPEAADVVFDADYLPSAEQKVIRPYDTEKLVNLLK